MVRLPLKESSQNLSNSLCLATKRFFRLKNRFRVLPELKDKYKSFIDEYKSFNHMDQYQLTHPQRTDVITYLTILFSVKIITKLRVVFDASAKTTSNNLMMIGPNV